MVHESGSSESSVNIVYEQRGVVVFNKPAGLLTQAPPGIDSLETRARNFLRARDELGAKFYLTPVHRLDRPVSGIVVFARNVRAAKRISAQFQERTVDKSYLSIVEGKPNPPQGTLTHFMRKIPDQAKSEIAEEGQPDTKFAKLEYILLEDKPGVSKVSIKLHTGRTHQIRLQFATAGHPIAGDSLYGSTRDFGEQTVDLRKRQIALHSWKIKFRHPIDDEDVDICQQPPAAWDEFSDGCG